MILRDWEIWFTFANYLAKPCAELSAAAYRLVDSSIVEAAMLHDGTSYWRDGGAVRQGATTIAVEHPSGSAQIAFPSGVRRYALEGLYQSAHMRFNERVLFGEEARLPPAYMRAILGECRFIDGEDQLAVYPMIKLHTTGVLLVHLRMVSPDAPLSTEAFINGYENASLRTFERVEVPPRLAAIAPTAQLSGSRLSIWRDISHARAVEELSRSEHSGDFTYEFTPMPLAPGYRESFAGLALTIISAVAYIISGPRRGVPLLVLGQKHLIEVGNYWSGRPHIHILRFEGQQSSASGNEAQHGADLGWMLGRVAGDGSQRGRQFLPANGRQTLDDFGAYVGSTASVWVQTVASLDRCGADKRSLVYENQAKVELLEYGHILHRRLAEQSTQSAASSREVLADQRDLVALESAMGEISHYGEIRDLLNAGWVVLGVPSLRERIAQNLALRQAETALAETEERTRWASLLTVVFGLLAVPEVTENSPIRRSR